MRFVCLIVWLYAGTAGCVMQTRSQPDVPPGDTVRVLVYNIHAGKDAHGVDNLARVMALIRETKADLVLLQEVDQGVERRVLVVRGTRRSIRALADREWWISRRCSPLEAECTSLSCGVRTTTVGSMAWRRCRGGRSRTTRYIAYQSILPSNARVGHASRGVCSGRTSCRRTGR